MGVPFDQQVTFLYVSNLDSSTDFYGGTLSLPMVLDQGGCRIFQVSREDSSAFACVTKNTPWLLKD